MAQRADDPDHKYHVERDRVKDSDLSEADKEAILRFLAAFDENDLSESYSNGNGTETLSYNSLESYGRAMRLIAKESDRNLLEHDLDTLTEVFNTFLSDLSKQTVRQRQAGAIKFYRFHGTGVDPDDIPLQKLDNNNNAVDERDMFTKQEIHDMREACDNLRDRCLLELLIYTGQRLRAIQTLRLKDIDLDAGVYYLNTEELGLKGADKAGKKRPLLGAEKAIRDWIDNHPTGEPDDYLITALGSATHTRDEGGYLSNPAIRDRLWKIADRADVYDKESEKGKPPNPHNFRHYFVTVCYREYDMDPSTIKFLIGHSQDSTVMETTYQHLTDEDHINAARRKTSSGRDAESKEGALTPETCPTCRENLPPEAKACPNCGQVFTPDAQQTQQKLQQDIGATKALSGDEISEGDLEQIAQDDALLAKLIELREE